MGVPLVEGRDLLVEGNHVFMRRTHGKRQVDVIYRRIDDDFLDPLAFRRDSMLGVPGLLNVYREGNVALANAPGAGVADDKSVYAVHAELIKYYLGEDAAPAPGADLPRAPEGRLRVHREHLDQLVVKTTGDAGGYGMLMGPFAAPKERETYLAAMKKNPGNYIAQPLVELSTHPTHVERQVRAAARRPPAVHPLRRPHPGPARRPHPGGAARGLLRGQLLPGRRQQGHLGPGARASA